MSHFHEWGNGIHFVRDDNDGQSYAVVGLTIGKEQNITINDIRNGHYRDAVTGHQMDVNHNSLSFFVHANSAGIYVLDGPGKIGEEGLYLR